jgi:hypothetical protein
MHENYLSRTQEYSVDLFLPYTSLNEIFFQRMQTIKYKKQEIKL